MRKTIKEIAKHFPSLKDKLVHLVDLQQTNLLQKQHAKNLPQQPFSSDILDDELILAAINQRVKEFRPYQFAKSIKFKKNWKIGIYILIPFIIFSVYFIFNPKQVKASTNRLLNFTSEFEKEFPFKIQIINSTLSVDYSQDFVLDVKVSGESIPDDLFIVIEDISYKLYKKDAFHFTYTFKKIFRNVSFKLKALDYISPVYTLTVFPRAMIMDIKIKLTYPSYTGKESEIIENSGDVECLEGTRMQWILQTQNMDYLLLKYNNVIKLSGDPIKFEKIAEESMAYFMVAVNSKSIKFDTLNYSINVKKDAYPQIMCEEFIDSLFPENRLYSGTIMDDYGFTFLCLHKEILENSKVIYSKIDTLQINTNTKQDFTYFLDLRIIPLAAGQSLQYYFEIKDNDVRHGFKSSLSSIFIYNKETIKQLVEKAGKSEQAIKNDILDIKKQITKSNSTLDKLSKDLVNSKNLSWEQQQAVQKAVDQQLSLFEKIKNLQKELEKNRSLENQLNTISPELLEKQKLLEDLLKDLMSMENKKDLEDLKKLLENINKPEKLQEKLSEWKEKQRDLQKEMERNSEIYKRMDFEKALEKSMDKLGEAKENLNNLNKEMKNSPSLNQELKNQQEQVKMDLEDLNKLMNEVVQKNENLAEPTKFKKPDDLLKQSKDLMEKASEAASKDNKKEAENKQESVADKLDQMEKSMEEMLDQMEQEEQGEDAESLRVLLKTIINTSKNQENLLLNLLKTKVNDPQYAEIIKKQGELKNAIVLISDSISAISVRQPKVASMTQKEVKQLLQYNRAIMNSLLMMNTVTYQRSGMRNSQATAEQQYLITSLNNLALLLSESLDQMKMSMKSKGNSSKKSKGKPSSSSSNPQNSKKKMQGLKEMQDELNKRLKEMQKSGKENAQGKESKNGMAKDFAKAAAQQEMIRRVLQEIMNEVNPGDAKTKGLLNKIAKEMEETEKDLVNKILNQQTMIRQQNIDQRLLEAENAQMKRDYEENRESTQGEDVNSVSPYLDNLLKEKLKNQKETIKFQVPELRNYYQEKVKDYLWK